MARDRSAISHHYDLSNDFYELLLDETMAYSCGYWRQPPGTEGYGPAQSQYDKLDLICRKLALRPGARLLDMGCGWGSLTVHAAEHFQAQVTAVTLSAEQARHTRERVRARGLEDRVRVRHCHYRDLPDGGFDAAATVEMGEHVGADAYPHFAARLRHALAPRGRLLVQQMSRGADAPGGGPFIETYIAPDMHMRPLGETVALLEEAGLEVRAATSLREHYVHTIDAWRDTLEAHWDAATALVGAPTARLWRLYLAGGRLAFAERRMGVDQILAVRPDEDGRSGLGARTRWAGTRGRGGRGDDRRHRLVRAGRGRVGDGRRRGRRHAAHLRRRPPQGRPSHRGRRLGTGVRGGGAHHVRVLRGRGRSDAPGAGHRSHRGVGTAAGGAHRRPRAGQGRGPALRAHARQGTGQPERLRAAQGLPAAGRTRAGGLPPRAGGAVRTHPARSPRLGGVCAVWLVGMFFETVGDAQLARFTARPENRGTVMDRGLWSWTRHPNYFGDFCVWWGLYLVAVTDGATALAVLVSPLLMSALLTVGSGKRLLEQHMAERPGYAAYAARTSGFLPRPPRRTAGGRS